MDQVTSVDQGLLWRLRERRQKAGLDCHRGLCAGDCGQETAEHRCLALYDPQILSFTLFEKTLLDQLFVRIDREDESIHVISGHYLYRAINSNRYSQAGSSM